MRSQSVVLVFVLMIMLPVSAVADKITMVADEWCPYNCNPASDAPGFIVEIAGQVFKKSGDEIEYTTMSWEQAVDAVYQGEFNAVVGISREEAPGLTFTPEPLGKMAEVFFAKKGSSWKYTDVDSLRQVKIGIIQGYSYGALLDNYFEENIDRPTVIVASGERALGNNIDKLKSGEIDLLLEDPNVFHYYFSSRGIMDQLADFMEIKAPGEPAFIYVAFSPGNPKSEAYAQTLSQGVEELRHLGKLSDILKKYGVSDWVE